MSDEIRVISLTQPWATLVAIGAKTIETRSWSVGRYRGPLAIHASKGFPPAARAFARSPLVQRLFSERGFMRDLPLGEVVAVARLVDCRSTGSDREPAPWLADLGFYEVAFGDYGPGRFGWFLEDVRALPEPIPHKGTLGLWKVPDELHALIGQQIALSDGGGK